MDPFYFQRCQQSLAVDKAVIYVGRSLCKAWAGGSNAMFPATLVVVIRRQHELAYAYTLDDIDIWVARRDICAMFVLNEKEAA